MLVSTGASVYGQQFQYSAAAGGDLIAGFRKPGLDNYELVVNLGNVYTNIEILTPGTTITFTNFSQTQLANAFPTGFGDLQWSVFSAFVPVGSSHGFPGSTLWYTQPRTDVSVQSTPPTRAGSGQSTIKQKMLGVPSGAYTISTSLSSNINNTVFLVREPVWDGVSASRSDFTSYIGDVGNPAIGNFQSLPVVENTTPSSFTSVARSDFYRVRPTGTADPETGLTTGPAYYLGYFSLNPNGTLTFTRGSSVVTPPPPPRPVLALQRIGTTNLISFATTNGAIYKLYFTNSAGFKTPLTNWPSISTNITGTGGTNSFMDITTDAVRFYGITAH